MAYDFKRNYTNTFTNGVTTELVNTQFRTLHGFFGPKFQTGSGPFRVFVTGKVGFDNFSINNQNATAGFVNTVGLTNGATYFALDIFFNGGAHNNLRVTFGPQFRF
jgi:hypothetical protein